MPIHINQQDPHKTALSENRRFECWNKHFQFSIRASYQGNFLWLSGNCRNAMVRMMMQCVHAPILCEVVHKALIPMWEFKGKLSTPLPLRWHSNKLVSRATCLYIRTTIRCVVAFKNTCERRIMTADTTSKTPVEKSSWGCGVWKSDNSQTDYF